MSRSKNADGRCRSRGASGIRIGKGEHHVGAAQAFPSPDSNARSHATSTNRVATLHLLGVAETLTEAAPSGNLRLIGGSFFTNLRREAEAVSRRFGRA